MCCPPASTKQAVPGLERPGTGEPATERPARNQLSRTAHRRAYLNRHARFPACALTRFAGKILSRGMSPVNTRGCEPLRQLSDTEAAYLAGIIDGEGTITLTRTHRGENRRPVVSISSTELSLLLDVRSVVGAGRITSRINAPHAKPSSSASLPTQCAPKHTSGTSRQPRVSTRWLSLTQRFPARGPGAPGGCLP